MAKKSAGKRKPHKKPSLASAVPYERLNEETSDAERLEPTDGLAEVETPQPTTESLGEQSPDAGDGEPAGPIPSAEPEHVLTSAQLAELEDHVYEQVFGRRTRLPGERAASCLEAKLMETIKR